MATKSLKVIAAKETARTNSKRDMSPKWDGADQLTPAQFTHHFHIAMDYYKLEFTSKDLKPKVIDWMGRNDYDRPTIIAFKKTKDWRCGGTMGAIASCLLRGMPEIHMGFNQNRSSSAWLKKEIALVIANGVSDVEEVLPGVVVAPVINIQERIRDQALQMSDEIDLAIDAFILDPDAFDPKEFKMISLLRGKGAKAAQSRYIRSFFERGHAELLELASGNADEQLREGYKHYPRKNIKKLIDFYESIATACTQIAAEAKVLKKPRVAKVKPAEDLVKKLKFKISDDKLGITSVPPAQLIGAQSAFIYNVKTRKIQYYIAKTSSGLSVKGTTLMEFTEKSTQKTLRTPALQLKEFKEQTTQKRVETWFVKNVKTVETLTNGRLNEDMIILRVFK